MRCYTPDNPTILTSDNLQRFLDDFAGHGVHLAPRAPLPDTCIVKSLCLLVRDQPLIVVLRLEDRLDTRKVASLLGLPNRAVRLAPEASVPHCTGYRVGCVPPIGHVRVLPTIVDAAVAATNHIAGGGGALDMQLLAPTAVLLHLAAAHVGDVVAQRAEPPDVPALVSMAPAALGLPLPYAPAQHGGLVHVVGRVVGRRRMARLLVFAHIVPAGGNHDMVRVGIVRTNYLCIILSVDGRSHNPHNEHPMWHVA